MVGATSRKCEWCGGKYLPIHPMQKYCGEVCRDRARGERRKVLRPRRTCPFCHKRFRVTRCDRIYCSLRCGGLANSERRRREAGVLPVRRKKACPECSAEFISASPSHVFCCAACQRSASNRIRFDKTRNWSHKRRWDSPELIARKRDVINARWTEKQRAKRAKFPTEVKTFVQKESYVEGDFDDDFEPYTKYGQ